MVATYYGLDVISSDRSSELPALVGAGPANACGIIDELIDKAKVFGGLIGVLYVLFLRLLRLCLSLVRFWFVVCAGLAYKWCSLLVM